MDLRVIGYSDVKHEQLEGLVRMGGIKRITIEPEFVYLEYEDGVDITVYSDKEKDFSIDFSRIDGVSGIISARQTLNGVLDAIGKNM